MSDQPIEWLDPRGLIQIENHGDNSDHGSNCHSHYGNICSRTWRPKELRGSVTEKFTPALISDLSMLSDCTFYIDQDKGEIKVTSSTEETLDRAHRKLNNLQREMV